MTRNDEMKDLLERTAFQFSGSIRSAIYLFIAIGIIGFLVGLMSGNSGLAWEALLANTLFFGGISLGGMMFSVFFTLTDANWGRPIKRLSEAMASFLPVFGILLVICFFGADHFFVWADHDKVIHSKAGWLNFPFFVERNVILFLITIGIGWAYLRVVLRPDIGLAKQLTQFSNSFADRLIKNYGGQKEEEEGSIRKARVFAIFLGISFWLLTSLLAFDWMMSIDQEWFSTMFGVQYMASCLITGSASLLIITGIVRNKYQLEHYISTKRYHDNSKLTFSFCMLWIYMVYNQVLVIWYGNLPEETPYIILRMQSEEWSTMFWVIFVMMFVVPFFGLMSRTACNSIWFTRIIAIDILVAIWLEKYFLIKPSIQENMADAGLGHGISGFHLNLFDISIALGVFGLFVLCYMWFLQRVPMVPISDKRFFSVAQH